MPWAVLVNLDIFSLEEVNSNSGGLKVSFGFIWKSPEDSSPLAIPLPSLSVQALRIHNLKLTSDLKFEMCQIKFSARKEFRDLTDFKFE